MIRSCGLSLTSAVTCECSSVRGIRSMAPVCCIDRNNGCPSDSSVDGYGIEGIDEGGCSELAWSFFALRRRRAKPSRGGGAYWITDRPWPRFQASTGEKNSRRLMSPARFRLSYAPVDLGRICAVVYTPR